MFQALKDGRQGIETSHDVYCSECGRLTIMRSKDNCEGGAEDIQLAGVSFTDEYSGVYPIDSTVEIGPDDTFAACPKTHYFT